MSAFFFLLIAESKHLAQTYIYNPFVLYSDDINLFDGGMQHRYACSNGVVHRLAPTSNKLHCRMRCCTMSYGRGSSFICRYLYNSGSTLSLPATNTCAVLGCLA
jgi:hypothetical protein